MGCRQNERLEEPQPEIQKRRSAKAVAIEWRLGLPRNTRMKVQRGELLGPAAIGPDATVGCGWRIFAPKWKPVRRNKCDKNRGRQLL